MFQIVHAENIEYLREHEPRKLRKYLIEMEDDANLIALDKANMSSGGASKPS